MTDEIVIAEGHAVVWNGEIDVRTVSESRRAAIVNWLVVNRGVEIMNGTTDEQISLLWTLHGGGAAVVGVEITKKNEK